MQVSSNMFVINEGHLMAKKLFVGIPSSNILIRYEMKI